MRKLLLLILSLTTFVALGQDDPQNTSQKTTIKPNTIAVLAVPFINTESMVTRNG